MFFTLRQYEPQDTIIPNTTSVRNGKESDASEDQSRN